MQHQQGHRNEDEKEATTRLTITSIRIAGYRHQLVVRTFPSCSEQACVHALRMTGCPVPSSKTAPQRLLLLCLDSWFRRFEAPCRLPGRPLLPLLVTLSVVVSTLGFQSK